MLSLEIVSLEVFRCYHCSSALDEKSIANMYSIKVPKLNIKGEPKNKIGLGLSAYRGTASTLCGGCGHDSVSAAIAQACFELSLPPHMIAKLSGIGCSSKTPSYFVSGAHAFNAIHGRMPAVASGANAAHRQMHYLAVSGDGDSGCIGLTGFAHAIKRRLNICYIVENNGVFGLTKGQFSATADRESKNHRGEQAAEEPVDLAMLALQLGASYVARAFAGDKETLVPMLKQALQIPGFALLDVISPCVSFNNHSGSTKSYAFVRANQSFLPEASTSCDAMRNLLACPPAKIALGSFYRAFEPKDLHATLGTVERPLRDIPLEELSPGKAGLNAIMAELR